MVRLFRACLPDCSKPQSFLLESLAQGFVGPLVQSAATADVGFRAHPNARSIPPVDGSNADKQTGKDTRDLG